MTRAAGDSPSYRFVLQNKATGEFEESQVIELPSVTSIIHRNLAAPALVPWAYRQTVESVEILLEAWSKSEEDPSSVFDPTFYEDDLDALLTEARLRPEDIRDEAAERGQAAHAWLERHAAGMEDHPTMRHIGPNLYEVGVTDWWNEKKPLVYASEKLLISLRYQYAGTVDLIWVDKRGKVVLTDLKTRDNTWTTAYESDLIQVAAYKQAWEEMTGKVIDRTSVLIVKPDGSWIEDSRSLPFESFLALLELDNLLKGVR